ncbi:MAG: hypothetical protein ACPGQL_08315 [Thermoplasmatota archaeon]
MANTTAITFAGVAALLALTSIVLPWWEGDFSASGGAFGGGSSSGDAEARPFDDGDMIDEEQATLAGILAVSSLGAAALGAVLFALGGDMRLLAGIVVLAAGALILAAGIIAVTDWPSDDMDFWDEQNASFGGSSASAETAAGFGWYAAIASGVLGIVGGLVGLTRR